MIWKNWIETPFPLESGQTMWIRYPLGEVTEADAERLRGFVEALVLPTPPVRIEETA